MSYYHSYLSLERQFSENCICHANVFNIPIAEVLVVVEELYFNNFLTFNRTGHRPFKCLQKEKKHTQMWKYVWWFFILQTGYTKDRNASRRYLLNRIHGANAFSHWKVLTSIIFTKTFSLHVLVANIKSYFNDLCSFGIMVHEINYSKICNRTIVKNPQNCNMVLLHMSQCKHQLRTIVYFWLPILFHTMKNTYLVKADIVLSTFNNLRVMRNSCNVQIKKITVTFCVVVKIYDILSILSF